MTLNDLEPQKYGSHFYPTLFTAAVCHSLDISIAPTLGRIIMELYRPVLWTILAIGDGGLVIGHPRLSWLRTVEADLRQMKLGLATAKQRAQDRSAWRLLVATATSSTSS